MAACIPSPTLTQFATVTSTTILSTVTVSVQTQPDGSVSSLTLPLIITSIITVVNPTLTLFASCSTPISTIPSSQSQSTSPSPSQSTSPQPSQSPSIPQYTPTTFVITTTPSPTVVTEEQSSTLNNGVVTLITITTTSTPSPTVVVLETSVTASPSQSPKSSSSNIAPIAGGAVGGFFFLIAVVGIIWLILKKCRKPESEREEEDIVFPYPVTRDRDQTRRLDLAKESRPYQYGLVGRSTPMTASGSGSSPALVSLSRASDGRRDSFTALIGGGLTPMASASGTVAAIQGAQTRGGEVGRQGSHTSTLQLPPGAAAPMGLYSHPSSSGASTAPGPSNRRPLQVINPPLSPMSARSSFPPGDMPGSSSLPTVLAPEPDTRSEKKSGQGLASSSDAIVYHSDGGRLQDRPSVSGSGTVPENKPSAQPERTSVEPTDAPPAYVA